MNININQFDDKLTIKQLFYLYLMLDLCSYQCKYYAIELQALSS